MFTTIFSTLGSIVPTFFDSIFGSVDPGHWEGNQFIPGDLQNRYNTVNLWIREFQLSPGVVDMQRVDEILKSPGEWQPKVRAYLSSLVGKSSPSNGNGFPDVPGIGGIDLTTVLIIVAVIGAAFAFTKFKK